MKNQQIIHLALDNLPKDIPVKGIWNDAGHNKEIEGELTMTIENKPVTYNVVVKNELRGHQLHKIFDLNKKHKPFMVVATHIFPKLKKELRQNNIAYIEVNGNIFLKRHGILLWIETNKPLIIERKTGNRAFTKTGLKVVFEFLRNENLVNQVYRVIAERTGTTVGNITNIINGLLKEDFLLPIKKNEYKLNNKKALLDKWVVAYGEKLKPAVYIGVFRFLKEEEFMNWKNIQLNTPETVWGGEPAGDLLTNYLYPEVLTIYTSETRAELIKKYRLIPDETGNVKVYQKFWQQDEDDAQTVPPLLVYADLMNTNDRRCIETAQKIYDAFIQNNL